MLFHGLIHFGVDESQGLPEQTKVGPGKRMFFSNQVDRRFQGVFLNLGKVQNNDLRGTIHPRRTMHVDFALVLDDQFSEQQKRAQGFAHEILSTLVPDRVGVILDLELLGQNLQVVA